MTAGTAANVLNGDEAVIPEEARIGMTAIVYTLSADEEETVSENNPENEETGEETGEDMQFEDLSMEGTRPDGEKERTKGKSSQGE